MNQLFNIPSTTSHFMTLERSTVAAPPDTTHVFSFYINPWVASHGQCSVQSFVI